MNTDFIEVIKLMELKFKSGNAIDVERTTITRNEWNTVVDVLKENNLYPTEDEKWNSNQ